MPGAVYSSRLFITSLCVFVFVCLRVCVPGRLCVNSRVLLLCLLHSVNVSAQAWAYVCKTGAFPFTFSYTWADGCGWVSEIPRTCRALVLCLQAKSSCCWSCVTCLCHDTKLIFYQLLYPPLGSWDTGAEQGCRRRKGATGWCKYL